MLQKMGFTQQANSKLGNSQQISTQKLDNYYQPFKGICKKFVIIKFPPYNIH